MNCLTGAAEALNAAVPSLLLQPLLENVAKHAVAARREPTRAVVRARRQGGRLHLEVEDDGPGLSATPPVAGIGLTNTRARLTKLYGEEHRFTLENRIPRGTRVAIDLPWREIEPPAPGAEELPPGGSS